MAKKKTRKKISRKVSVKRKPKAKSSMFPQAVKHVAAIALLVVIAVIISKTFGKEGVAISNEDVVAFINNEPVYQSALEKEFQTLPQELQLTLDQKAVLAQLIDKRLLLQEAIKSGTEVQEEIDLILQVNGITMEQLEENIATQGLTVEEFKDQLRIFKFLNETLFEKLSVSDNDAELYYGSNPELFIAGESARARHILVSTDERTDEEALAIMNDVQEALETNAESFCDLVTEYSDDVGSLSTCGQYLEPNVNPIVRDRTPFIKEFVDAAFTNDVGEASVVKTQFGYHLIQTLEKTPQRIVSFEEAKNQIKANLQFEQQKEVFALYIQQLRSQSEIINCFETPELCSSGEDSMTETEEDEQEVTLSPVEESVESDDSLTSLAKCLGDNGVKMYGAYWCTRCESQKKLFGESFEFVEYVECSEEGDPRSQTEICAREEISGYPTWEINGRKYAGSQTLQDLARLSGCEL